MIHSTKKANKTMTDYTDISNEDLDHYIEQHWVLTQYTDYYTP
jgi:hypothetical protein